MNDNPSPHGIPSVPEVSTSPEAPAAVERELPPGRHDVLREHLMREIENRTVSADGSGPAAVRPLWRRPAFVAPAVAAALTAAVVVGAAVTQHVAGPSRPDAYRAADRGDGTPSDRSAADVLERAAEAAEQRKRPAIRDDQFVYTKREDYHWKMDEDLMASGCIRTQEGHPFGIRESWTSVDGKHVGLSREKENGEVVERNLAVQPRMKGYVGSYREAEDELPTDVEGMYRYLYGAKAGKERAAGGKADKADRAAFEKGATLLAGQLLPPKAEVALYRALARIPGLTVYEGARDTAGRKGVSVGIAGRFPDFGQGLSRHELLFDERTSAFLAFNSVNLDALDDDCETLREGDMVSSEAILKRGVVDRAGERP